METSHFMRMALVGLALLAGWPGGARADGPLTVVWFGTPASSETGTPEGPRATGSTPRASEIPVALDAPDGAAPGEGEASSGDAGGRREPSLGPSAPMSPEPTEAAPCPRAVTLVRRMGGRRERARIALLDCDGSVREDARRTVSLLARPRDVTEPPSEEEMRAWRDGDADPEHLSEHVRLVHPGLLERLQRIGEAFVDHPIEIVSGYRPDSSESSRHHHARALDLRVLGVEREQLRDLAVTFTQTGVGWYPNSTFVHVDVRETEAYWVDLSGPGQRPRYVRGVEPPTVTTPPSAVAAPGIDDALETLRLGLRVTLPGEEPAALADAVEPPEDVPPPTDAELEEMREQTEAILRGIRVGPPTGG